MDTLGVVEMQSIASGAEVADAMVKSAEVDMFQPEKSTTRSESG